MNFLKILILALVVSCHSYPHYYASHKTERRYKSVVRVLIECGSGFGLGSGVATGPHTVYTAKHVVTCNGETPVAVKILTWDNVWQDASIAALADGEIDVARLTVKDPLDHWLEISTRTLKVGERTCYMGGNGHIPRILTKCGEVYEVKESGEFWSSIFAMPGNSGGPMLDEYGRVIGVLVYLDATGEHASGAMPASKFP